MEQATPSEKPWAVISISHEADHPTIVENDSMKGRLNMIFHDIDGYKNGEPENEERTLFDAQHAKEVLDFYEAMLALDVSVMYVHCLMGQSRSAGVAAALTKALTGDDSAYFGRGQYKPNMRVFRLVLEECHARGMI